MAAQLENIYFMTDLAWMVDILNEISPLSNALQARKIDITMAGKPAFQTLRKGKSACEKVDELTGSDAFKNIKLVGNH